MSLRDDLKKFVNALGLAVEDVTSSKAMRAYGKASIKLIVARTRRGFGVQKTGTRQFRLARLKPSTIRRRRAFTGLSSETSPGKSNLTFTGKMLDSIFVKSARDGEVIIGPDRRRRKGGVTNEEISSFAEKGSSNRKKRPYLALSTKELRDINREFGFTFEKALKRRL